MTGISQLKQTQPETELMKAMEEMDRDGVNQLPVMENGELVGMLSREDVISYLRTLHELER
jgi:CBS domain-containing protein